jgi:LmbE family N-acetylglucosaminyl deacetylase
VATVFVRSGKRRGESQRSLAHLGVPLRRQVYLELPDARLPDFVDEFGVALAGLAMDFRPDRWFTTGADGYDGHDGHIAAHRSARIARGLSMTALGTDSVLCALASNRQGELMIGGFAEQKLGALAFHESQRTHPDLRLWGGTDLYTSLIVGAEMYTTVNLED